MEDEESFAKLLSQSTVAAPPSWSSSTPNDDPWANPFSDTASTSNPFANDPIPPFGSTTLPTFAKPNEPDSPVQKQSPYVARLQEDADKGVGTLPDPPSVIAAREQAVTTGFRDSSDISGGFGGESHDVPFSSPFSSPSTYQPPHSIPTSPPVLPPPPAVTPPRKALPSDLIDEDLLAASDPSISLKKAFVKSSPAPASKIRGGDTKPKAYIFSPSKKGTQPTPTKEKPNPKIKAKPASVVVEAGDEQMAKKADGVIHKPSAVNGTDLKEPSQTEASTHGPVDKEQETKVVSLDLTPPSSRHAPTSIPLPDSNAATPTATRPATPLPPTQSHATPEQSEQPEPSPATSVVTPSIDRVAVSPLDAPGSDVGYGFKSLTIGAASETLPPLPPFKSPAQSSTTEWPESSKSSNTSGPRFGGRGWGALDEEDDGGLFGKGGPSVRPSDPWATHAGETGSGWGEPGLSRVASSTASADPSLENSQTSETVPWTSPTESVRSPKPNGTPRTPKLLSKPLFQITVGDPTRVGDPVRGYTVYTVRTSTTSPHYRRGEFSVLRRFSDFLWLFETLTMNNPGVIVPPMPDKHPFGRFQDTFIETRRQALQRGLAKITSHPVLQLDPDLRLFLESDQFAIESKNRRSEAVQMQEKSGLLAGWTGSKYVEQDDWFESRKTFLDSLESQLRQLSKSIDGASKTRLEMAMAMCDFADSMTGLAQSDLGSAMCAALARLADLATREKETNEEQAKAEVVHLLNLSDEYLRFIGSVRVAFTGRVKCYERWQGAEREVMRLRMAREKTRQQGRLGDRAQQTLAEVGEAERRSRDASKEFEVVSKLVKSEFARFERERIEEFKRVLETHLDAQLARQKELIGAWEEYHGVVLKMVQKAQGQKEGGTQSLF